MRAAQRPTKEAAVAIISVGLFSTIRDGRKEEEVSQVATFGFDRGHGAQR